MAVLTPTDETDPGRTRVALVTGAAGGIGSATVRRLVADGSCVMALDWCGGDEDDSRWRARSNEDLDALAASLPADRVIPYVADVRDPSAVAAAVRTAVDRWGRLDAVVAGAAVMAGGKPLWEDDSLDLLLQVDVVGVWNTATAAIPEMLSGPDPSGCRFVAIASTAGEHGLYRLAAYTTAKHAVVGLIRGLAADLAGTGVTAVAVAPGSTDTPMLATTAEVYGVTTDELVSHQMIKRALTADELASVVTFACSRDGVVFNGSVLNADGGFIG